MASTGWITPTASTVETGSGTWTNPTNIHADDGAEATFSLTTKNTSGRWNVGQTFNFNSLIPAGATIDSVEIRAEWRVNNAGGIGILELQAFVSGGAVGAVRANSAEPTTLTTDSFNITADRAWTRADLLNGTLELKVRGRNGNSTTDPSYRVDHIAVQVNYTEAAQPIEEDYDPLAEQRIAATRNYLTAALALGVSLAGSFDFNENFIPPPPEPGGVVGIGLQLGERGIHEPVLLQYAASDELPMAPGGEPEQVVTAIGLQLGDRLIHEPILLQAGSSEELPVAGGGGETEFRFDSPMNQVGDRLIHEPILLQAPFTDERVTPILPDPQDGMQVLAFGEDGISENEFTHQDDMFAGAETPVPPYDHPQLSGDRLIHQRVILRWPVGAEERPTPAAVTAPPDYSDGLYVFTISKTSRVPEVFTADEQVIPLAALHEHYSIQPLPDLQKPTIRYFFDDEQIVPQETFTIDEVYDHISDVALAKLTPVVFDTQEEVIPQPAVLTVDEVYDRLFVPALARTISQVFDGNDEIITAAVIDEVYSQVDLPPLAKAVAQVFDSNDEIARLLVDEVYDRIPVSPLPKLTTIVFDFNDERTTAVAPLTFDEVYDKIPTSPLRAPTPFLFVFNDERTTAVAPLTVDEVYDRIPTSPLIPSTARVFEINDEITTPVEPSIVDEVYTQLEVQAFIPSSRQLFSADEEIVPQPIADLDGIEWQLYTAIVSRRYEMLLVIDEEIIPRAVLDEPGEWQPPQVAVTRPAIELFKSDDEIIPRIVQHDEPEWQLLYQPQRTEAKTLYLPDPEEIPSLPQPVAFDETYYVVVEPSRYKAIAVVWYSEETPFLAGDIDNARVYKVVEESRTYLVTGGSQDYVITMEDRTLVVPPGNDNLEVGS